MCLFEVLLFASDRLLVSCSRRNCLLEFCLLLVNFWNPSFHFRRTKRKETERMNKRRSEQPARRDLEQEGAAHPARRCESRTFVFTFSPGSLEANQTSLCQRTTLARSWLLSAARRNNIWLWERDREDV